MVIAIPSSATPVISPRYLGSAGRLQYQANCLSGDGAVGAVHHPLPYGQITGVNGPSLKDDFFSPSGRELEGPVESRSDRIRTFP